MLPQIIRWTVLFGLWKKFRKQIVVTIATLVLLLLISIVHQDFVAYQGSLAQPNETWLAWSFLLKWLLYLSVAGGYLAWLWKTPAANSNSKLHQEMADIEQFANSKSSDNSDLKDKTKGDDPFANIRAKTKLRSKAEFIIEQNKDNN